MRWKWLSETRSRGGGGRAGRFFHSEKNEWIYFHFFAAQADTPTPGPDFPSHAGVAALRASADRLRLWKSGPGAGVSGGGVSMVADWRKSGQCLIVGFKFVCMYAGQIKRSQGCACDLLDGGPTVEIYWTGVLLLRFTGRGSYCWDSLGGSPTVEIYWTGVLLLRFTGRGSYCWDLLDGGPTVEFLWTGVLLLRFTGRGSYCWDSLDGGPTVEIHWTGHTDLDGPKVSKKSPLRQNGL